MNPLPPKERDGRARRALRIKNGWLFSVLIGNPLVKGTDFLEPSSSLHQAA